MTEIKGCPFCGLQPNWLSKSNAYGTGASGMEPPSRALGCDNPACEIAPHTPWRDTEEWKQGKGYYRVNYDSDAIAVWNKRAVDA